MASITIRFLSGMLLGLSLMTSIAVAAEPPPLIPRDLLFGNPDRSSVQISPDGQRIAYLSAVNGVMNVWVAPRENLAAAEAVTNDTLRGIRQYFWTYTGRHLVYLQDTGGDENFHLFAVNLTTKTTKDLTPYEGARAEVAGVSDRIPGEILVGLNDRDPQFHDVYRINIETGERTLVFRNEQYAGTVADDDYRVRLAVQMRPDGGFDYSTIDADGNAEPFDTIEYGDSLTTSYVGFNKAGDSLFVLDSRGRNTAALFTMDLKTKEKKLLAEDARADVGGTMSHPSEQTVQAVSFEYTRVEWKILDPRIKPDLDYLESVTDGDVNVGSRSHDDRFWTVAYTSDSGPVKYYLYDRTPEGGKPGKATFLFTNRKALEGVTLAKMHPVVIRSRDNLSLVSYLTLPVETDANGDARPDSGALPLILNVHGGPWARDNWGLDPEVQFLANRGYAVLQVNFRGSTGFGKEFVNAGDREWAGKMHDDLLDAVAWAVQEKIADPKKVAIMGGSYGGYATLVGLTFTPEVFACGVDIVGPSNINTLLSTIPAYWGPVIGIFRKRVGDNTTDEGRKFLDERSPLSRVDRIARPLLIGQGANDPRVKQAESDQIVAAMKAKSIPVTYVLFPDEGHGFARPVNRLAFYAVTEAFLSEHLGGRVEPFGPSLQNSTAEVPVGAEFVRGLKEAVSLPRESKPGE